MNVNQIVRIIPTLKANNRKLNETFYIETLGSKVSWNHLKLGHPLILFQLRGRI